MERMRTTGETRISNAGKLRRIYCRTHRNRENHRAHCPLVFLARDTSRHSAICPTLTVWLTSRCSNRPPDTSIPRPFRPRGEQVSTVSTVGPLPRFRSGHTSLLVAQDRFSKWIELQPFRKATTQATLRHLTDRFIYRHGCLQVIISDNSRQFISTKF